MAGVRARLGSTHVVNEAYTKCMDWATGEEKHQAPRLQGVDPASRRPPGRAPRAPCGQEAARGKRGRDGSSEHPSPAALRDCTRCRPEEAKANQTVRLGWSPLYGGDDAVITRPKIGANVHEARACPQGHQVSRKLRGRSGVGRFDQEPEVAARGA